jgi:UDP-GlcNAc:undecaprenyl-phosphate GlcNAc-1-phosphate transferase
MAEQAVYAFVFAVFLSMVLVPPLVRIAAPLGMVDTGGGRKLHSGRVPRIGGVAIFFGFLVPILLSPARADLPNFITAIFVLFFFGLLDDRFNLDFRVKLLGQIVAALIVSTLGGVLIEHIPFLPSGAWPTFVALPFTVIVLVGITNAVNLSDGLDGLAGGITLLAGSGLFLLVGLEFQDAGSMLIALAALMGAVLGFLRFNSYPAQLFMGDTGSQFLGFSIAVLSIIITQGDEVALDPMLPILLLGLPILDTLAVMVTRIARGRSPFEADRTHLHHRLIASGLTQTEAVSLIYAGQALLVIAAILLRDSGSFYILLTYILFCCIVLIGIHWLERRPVKPRGEQSWFLRLWRIFTRPDREPLVNSALLRVLGTTIPLFFVLGSLAAQTPSHDIGILAAVLLFALTASLLFKVVPAYTPEHLSAYTAAVAVVYLLGKSPAITNNCGLCLPLLYAGIALVAATYVRFSEDKFRVSAFDLLVVLGAIAAPSLRTVGLEELGIVALQAIIVFYALEILFHADVRRWDALRVSVIVSLSVLAFRGLVPA